MFPPTSANPLRLWNNSLPVTPQPQPERTLILAPRGRDALVANGILRDAQIQSKICLDLTELFDGMQRGADVAILTEEAVREADTAR